MTSEQKSKILIDLINEERQKKNLPILQESQILDNIAEAHSLHMQKLQTITHESDLGYDSTDLIKQKGLKCKYYGEDISGESNPVKLWDMIKGSKGHLRPLMSNAEYIGSSFVPNGLTSYTTIITC